MEYRKHLRLMRFLGLGGVSAQENETAVRWGKRLEAPMVLAAIWILISWYLESKGMTNGFITFMTDWMIWLIFLTELILMLMLVDNRQRYLQHNWMSLLIVLAGLPVLWGVDTFYAGIMRTMRLALTLGIFFRVSADVRSLLSRHHLGITLFVCFIILVASGLLISGIDPAFETPMDGLWWAWVTVTTVGYGDLVPVTTEGRLFGALLILMGIAMFSMLTASFSVFFIEQDERDISEQELQNIRRMERLERKLERLENKLDKTMHALDQQNGHSDSPSEKADTKKSNQPPN